MAEQTMVIIGGGLAGAKAAQALREQSFAGQIIVIAGEPHRPYERPPLSKGYLQGSAERESVFVHPADWYAAHDVDLRIASTAVALDLGSRKVTLSGGTAVGYDRLLLATGAEPRLLDAPGTDLAGVHYLRRLEDSDRLRETFARASRVVVVGAGWIGLETAAAARLAGAAVTVLEAATLPLVGVLGPEAAQVFADLHRDHGVDLRVGVGVSALTGRDGRVSGVVLADGTHVPADAVVVGVGIAPNVSLAVTAGLDVDNGVVVDEHLRTSDPNVFAAGDVANAWHPFLRRRIRVEHWANALNQPAVAAAGMLGRDAVYDRLPYFFSDQYDLGMEYVGHVAPGEYDRVVFRGDVAGREFVAFWLAQGRVVAGMNVNVWDVVEPIVALITSRRTVDAHRLTDLGTPLEKV